MKTLIEKYYPGVYCLILLAVLLLSPLPAIGKNDARISEIVPMNSDHELFLYFSLQDAFTDEMIKGIENGVPVTFSFFAELYRVYDSDVDRKIASQAFDHTLSYDPLKQEYYVQMEERSVENLTFTNFSEACASMTEINDLPLVDLSRLETGGRYVVKVKAKLAKKDLPMNFQSIIPFWQLWKFETNWHSMSFIYGNSGSTSKR